jgi:hypothetical protein
MPIARSYPMQFTPKGLCDAFDSTEAFKGACQSLSNLVFDQANPEVVVSRPGVGAPLTSFAGFATPTFVSVQIVLGTMVYGMVSTARTAGHDEPFAYNILTNTFVTISGVTSSNVPASPATGGAWTPPTMAVVSTYILVTHPGFSGAGANIFGAINIATPSAPVWTAQDLLTNPMGVVPTSVANFNNRAYFSYGTFGNHLALSDPLTPLTRTNASQDLTIGDTTPITAQSGLPVETTSSGVVGALVVFKGESIWQITGDPATTANPLSLNYISLNTGCSAPRSIALGPFGIFFAGVDAPYVLNFIGMLAALSSNPGQGGPADVQVPFQNAVVPSRISGSFSGNIYRVCVPTSIQGVQQTNDYWFDIRRKRWTGPHTFNYDCASYFGNNFIVSGAGTGAALFMSQSIPTQASVYNDNGAALTSVMQSSSFPKTGHMAQLQVIESTLELSSSGGAVNYNVTALDEQNSTINSVGINSPAAGSLWGSFLWGAANWASSVRIPHVYNVPWTVPLNFQKMALEVTASSAEQLSIGTFFARYQDTGYTNRG